MESPTSEQSQEPKSGFASALETLGAIVSFVTNIFFLCTLIGAVISFILGSPVALFAIFMLAVIFPIWMFTRRKKGRNRNGASKRVTLALPVPSSAEKPAALLLPSGQTVRDAEFEERPKSDQ